MISTSAFVIAECAVKLCWLNSSSSFELIYQLEERESDAVLPLIDKASLSSKVVVYSPRRNDPGEVGWGGQGGRSSVP